ncbi:MAG TPA: alpha/beta hydrolase [Roseiflexaceae bacterium]|nr:alpha/beta hydrolase [Roseiflexaceae bacterium]
MALFNRKQATAAPDRFAGLRVAGEAVNLGLAALSVFRAPNTLLWMASIGSTEWGHVLALLGLAPLLTDWRRSRAGRLSAGLGAAAALLELTPLLRALPVARDLPSRLRGAFGDSEPRTGPGAPALSRPLSAAKLLGVRSPRVVVSTHTYANREGHNLLLDIYQPRERRGRLPGVLVIHGGAWRAGDRTQLPALNRYLAARGYLVAALSYRLAPDHRFPAAHQDVQAALGYLKANADALELDADRLALVGRSAGGHLALLAAYALRDPSIRGVVSFYGPADLRYGYAHPANPAVIDTRLVQEQFLGGSPEQVPEVYDAASPILFVGPDTPPTLLIHGGRDELVSPRQSALLAERLAQVGRPHLLLHLPWATHGCDLNFSGPAGQLSTYAIERFLASACA